MTSKEIKKLLNYKKYSYLVEFLEDYNGEEVENVKNKESYYKHLACCELLEIIFEEEEFEREKKGGKKIYD